MRRWLSNKSLNGKANSSPLAANQSSTSSAYSYYTLTFKKINNII